VELKTNNNQMKFMKSTKTMLIAALTAGALLACGSSLLAQDSTNTPPAGASPAGGQPGGGMRGRGPSLEQLTKALDLTDDQKPKVKAALDEQMQKMGELRKDPDFAGLSREDKMAKMKPIRDAYIAKMKDILTPEQFAKSQKMGSGMRGNRPPGGGGTSGATPPSTDAKPPQN
jgi:Spy/CpxP family protein refolding chaperone